jgi:hypothetical protein
MTGNPKRRFLKAGITNPVSKPSRKRAFQVEARGCPLGILYAR